MSRSAGTLITWSFPEPASLSTPHAAVAMGIPNQFFKVGIVSLQIGLQIGEAPPNWSTNWTGPWSSQPLPWLYPVPMGDPVCQGSCLRCRVRAGWSHSNKCTKCTGDTTLGEPRYTNVVSLRLVCITTIGLQLVPCFSLLPINHYWSIGHMVSLSLIAHH
jgi:hypothetical protein